MLRAFPMSLTRAASRWLRNEPSSLIITWEAIKKKILSKYYPQVPTRQILDSKGAIPTMTAKNARVAIQEMAEHSQKWHDGMSTRTRSTETSDGLASIQAQLNNLGREIKKVNDKCMLLKWVVNYARDLITQRIIYSKKKEKNLKKHITLNWYAIPTGRTI
ncbi:hypothetical protein Tco_1114798 [Tanacetum coccineum]